MSRIDSERKNICGENIKRYREEKGMSLEQCCVELQKAGLSLSSKELNQIEQEKRIVLDQEIICFCKVLSITIEQLFENVSL